MPDPRAAVIVLTAAEEGTNLEVQDHPIDAEAGQLIVVQLLHTRNWLNALWAVDRLTGRAAVAFEVTSL